MIFAGLGFEVEFEPAGKKGPDLSIKRDGAVVRVEVTRFRKMNPGPPMLNINQENLVLPAYGDLDRDIRKAIQKISGKFAQVRDEQGIIAIWNDDEDLEEVETRIAVDAIRVEVSKGIRSLPTGLLFVLYGSKWRGDKQLHCFPFRHLIAPYQEWAKELEMGEVSHHIEHALP